LEGKVIGQCMKRHRHQEFIRFLNVIDAKVAKKRTVHVIVDNYAAHKHPKVLEWIENHPRFVFHFTPTSASWLNAVESFFAKLTKKRLKRGVSAPSRNSKMPSTASSTTPMQTQSLYLGQGPQQNHRRRQARAPIVRFDPLGLLFEAFGVAALPSFAPEAGCAFPKVEGILINDNCDA
jgi:transposase